MTNTTTLAPHPAAPDITIEAAIARFGAARVLLVALSALLNTRARRSAQLPEGMSDHLMRDIGLAPRAASPPLDVLTRHMW